MENSTLGIISIVVVVAMLSVALGVVPIQEANAARTNTNKNGIVGSCNGGSGSSGNSCIGISQNTVNKCKGHATCTNTPTINFGLLPTQRPPIPTDGSGTVGATR